MDTFDFSRLGVLLVEDNSYIRVTLENVLRQFRFGRIESVNDGQQAVEYMKKVGSAGTNNPPDIIISDLVMAPINGLLFLRWVRTSKDSVDRMVPFIMLSGAADQTYVNSARDLGCNEFLAKPFSVDTVYKHLVKLIEQPRQFVTTTEFFGPERRRQKPGTPKKERRLKEEEDVTIVYSADKVVKPKAPTDVWYFRLPNKLKEKAGGAGFTGAAEMPMDILKEAEEQLERAALDFTTWAQDYLKRLLDICVDALLDETERGKHFAEINLLALELRGQGGTFGYPLISTLGKMLYDATVEGCPKDNNAVEIVKAHVDAMRAVLREKVAGEGGEIGLALLASLNQAIDTKQVIEPKQAVEI